MVAFPQLICQTCLVFDVKVVQDWQGAHEQLCRVNEQSGFM